MTAQDTTVTDTEVNEEVDNPVETLQEEDEQLDNQENQENVTDTEENEGESESEEGEQPKPTEEEEAKFEKRFSQIQGETQEDYLKNLEEAYRNSSTEGQRLAIEAKEDKKFRDQVAAAIANDPDLAARLQGTVGKEAPAPYVDPALAYARELRDEQFNKEYGQFTDAHPEMISDEALREKVLGELETFADAYAASGRRLGMAEGLKKAWISLGLDIDDKKEKVMTQAKTQAAQPQAQPKPKAPVAKPQFTDEQIAFAKKMGLSPEQLAEYSK